MILHADTNGVGKLKQSVFNLLFIKKSLKNEIWLTDALASPGWHHQLQWLGYNDDLIIETYSRDFTG